MSSGPVGTRSAPAAERQPAGAEVVDQLRGLPGVLPHAPSPDAARRLREVSEELLAAARAAA